MKRLAQTLAEQNIVFDGKKMVRSGATCDKYFNLLSPSGRRLLNQLARSVINRNKKLSKVSTP